MFVRRNSFSKMIIKKKGRKEARRRFFRNDV